MSKAWCSRRGSSTVGFLVLLGAVAVSGCQSAPAKKPAKKPPAKNASAPAKGANAGGQAAGKKAPQAAPLAAAPKTAPPKNGPPSDTRENLSPPGGAPAGNLGKDDGVRAQQERELAKHYFEVGKRLFDTMDYSRAYDNLRMSVEKDPTNQAAVELYYTCGSIIGKREDELKASLERISREHVVKVELTKQEMLRFFEAGEKEFNAGNFDQAIRTLERAREMIAWYPYQIDTGTPPYRERIEKMVAEAKKKRLEAELEQRDRMEKLSVEKARQQERHKLLEDTRRLETLLNQTHDFIQARRFADARELALRILEIDPRNPFAKKYLEYANLGIHTQTEAGLLTRKSEETWGDDLNTSIAEIPQEFEYIRYTPDWDERTRGRKGGVASENLDEAAWIKNVKRILRERKISVNFPDHPLTEVIAFLQEITGLNFVIGPGVDATEKRVSVKLKDIVLEKALNIILEQAKLVPVYQNESIIISEPGTTPGELIFDIYDVSDILFKIPDFTAQRLQLPDPSAPAGGGGGGNSLVFDDNKANEAGTFNLDNLIDIVKKSTGDEEAWADPAHIEGHRGQLLVTATREKHKEVSTVLDNLRRNQGLFVHIETRFIDINNDMLEDFGIDFRGLGGNPNDTAILPNGQPNPAYSGSYGVPGDAFSDVKGGADAKSKYGGTDWGGATRDRNYPFARQGGPIPGPFSEPGSDNFVYRTMNIFGGPSFLQGGNVLRGSRMFGGGGLTLQVTQLDHWQMNAILNAEAEESRARKLTAPRVTAANREKVFTSVITQRAYIADWQLISGGTGLVVVEVPDPIVMTFEEGVVLEVRPTVSSDRKFVTLDVRPSMATLNNGQISTIIVNLGSLSMTAIQVPIDIPQISLEEAFTSVTLPDGGTALLGGFRQITSQKNESSMPIIDSVPLLNVLFRRKGEIRETRSLVVLITANIISIRDEAAKRFNKQN